jgi:hypothetical protein
MTRVASTITIHAPADTIWQVISDFGAACQYLAMVGGQGHGHTDYAKPRLDRDPARHRG